jgi:hypothetical protein
MVDYKNYINNVSASVQAYNNTLQLIDDTYDQIDEHQDTIKSNNY